jgi:hypothetical protein
MPIQVNPPVPGSPGEELDTGTGGFPVEGKRNAYDVGSTVGDETKIDWSPGNVKVDQTDHDLSKGTKRTLASYLSKTSMGLTPSAPSPVPNKYPIDQNPSDDPVTVSLKDEKGYPSSPTGVSNSSKFVPETLLSSRSEAAANLKMIRGRQFPYGGSSVDGNTLLKNATTRTSDTVVNPSALGGKLPPIQTTEIDDTSPIKNYYGNPNVSNSVIFNRFNPEGREYQTQSAPLNSEQFAKKYALGTSQAERDMSFGRLARVGEILSSRASDELSSMEPGYIPGSTETLPGVSQLGVNKIERDELTARSVIDGLTDAVVEEESLSDLAGKSWGTLNNINDQFSGLGALGMQLLAVALLVALAVIITALSAIFSVGSTESTTVAVRADGKRRLGSSAGFTTSSSRSLLGSIGSFLLGTWQSVGIEPTINPISSCICVGALAFFGIREPKTTPFTFALNAALDGSDAVTQSPGYYSILGRVVGRSFLQLIEAVSPVPSAFDSGLLSGASQILNVIGSLRGSRFIKVLNIFAKIGDQFIRDSQREDNDLDKIPETSALRDRMSPARDSGGNILTTSTKLGWSSYRAPDMFLVPSGLNKVINSISANKMGAHAVRYKSIVPGYLNKSLDGKTYNKVLEDSRISPDDRKNMEKILESEYVPFYMHDVRTNEIVSFHAFLASLTDDYSAQYDTSEGFGRVEPIKIYKSTTRKIGFSFYVAATSAEDFESMWMKINKLTTMVYPQFSEGRTITSTDKNTTIYAPFSQTIQASPLVRVRIGDLITSNYSKFNLARIFGYTYAGTKFNGKELPSSSTESENEEERYLKSVNQARGQAGNRFTGDPLLDNPKPPSGGIPSDAIKLSAAKKNFRLPKGLMLQVTGVVGNAPDTESNLISCKVVLPDKDDNLGITDKRIKELKDTYGNKNEPYWQIIDNGFEYVVLETDLLPAPNLEESLREASSGATGPYSKEVREFMDDNDKGNIIAKSFRSSGGKGLAGFIESMSFDWYDRATWDINPGRKAPKMCKVTISFSPIHDITPGLDHMGANRAPLYRVGS